jgi:4-amino-4-deoxy-L-arabinose transferase-like glycosyltransferase
MVPGWELVDADESQYHSLAVSMLDGQGYSKAGGPAAEWPPLYPILLSAVYFVAGRSAAPVYCAQALLGAATVYGVYRLSLSVFEDEHVAVLSAFVLSAYPLFIFLNKSLLSENLYVPLLIWHLYFLHQGLARNSRPHLGLSAVLLALTALTRSFIAPIVAAYAVMLPVVLPGRFASRARTTFAYALVFVLVLLPWTVRNYLAFDEFVPLTTSIGGTLYAGYSMSDYVYGNSPVDAITKASEYEEEQRGAVAANRLLVQESVKIIVEHPYRLPGLMVKKLAYFIMPFDYDILPRFPVGNNPGFNSPYVFLLPFFLIGVYQANRARYLISPLLIVLGYMLVMCILILGLPRYRLPVEPLIVLFASFAMASFWHHPNRRMIYSLSGAYLACNLLVGIYVAEVKAWIASLIA